MDMLEEKASMLSRLGSFWYRTLQDEEKDKAKHLSHLSFATRCNRQAANAMDAAVNGGYFPDHYRVVRFNDADISYFGTEGWLQKRYNSGLGESPRGKSRGARMTTSSGFVADTGSGVVAEETPHPVLFPDGYGEMELADYPVVFGLSIPANMYVTTIEREPGVLMMAGIDFVSEFGRILFQENPISLFPEMKFMARSCVYRHRNLYSYPLWLDDCYNDVSYVWKYYRTTQSLPAFRLALLQACGLPVMKEACRIVKVTPLLDGCSYHTSDGNRYDAPFRHAQELTGKALQAGDVIGTDVLDVILPWQPLPPSVKKVEFGSALAVDGLSAANAVGPLTDGYGMFMPELEGDTGSVADYHDLLLRNSGRSEVYEYNTGEGNDNLIYRAAQLAADQGRSGCLYRVVAPCRSTESRDASAGGYLLIREKTEDGNGWEQPIASRNYSKHVVNGSYEWWFSGERLHGRIIQFCLVADPSSGWPSNLTNHNMNFSGRNVPGSLPSDTYMISIYGGSQVKFLAVQTYYFGDEPAAPPEGNVAEYMRGELLTGRSVVVAGADSMLGDGMRLRAHEFAQREHPVGSVVLYASKRP